MRSESKKINHPVYGKGAILADSNDNKPFVKQMQSFSGVTKLSDHQNLNINPDIESTNTLANTINTKEPYCEINTQKIADIGNIFQTPCMYCKDKTHSMEFCQVFKSLLFNDRIQYLRGGGVCYGCLKFGHRRADCHNKAACTTCKGRHPYILHIERAVPVVVPTASTPTMPLQSYAVTASNIHTSSEALFCRNCQMNTISR